MPLDSSIRAGGKLYDPLVRKSERIITRLKAKWGVPCDLFYCQNNLNDLNLYQINTDDLKYNDLPDVENIILCIPAMWENFGMNDFNINSHSSEEKDASIYDLPSVKIPILTKVVARANNTNRSYIIRKTVLEHYPRANLFLEYILDVMPNSDDTGQMSNLQSEYAELSIFNGVPDITTEELLPDGITIDRIGR